MIYPNKMNKVIGLTAASDGIIRKEKLYRLDSAIKNLEKEGFSIIETENVRTSNLGRSANKEERANQLMSLYLNKDIEAIYFPTGGDFLIEILPLLDLNVIKNNVKWTVGYSDITTLTYIITTKLDIATLHADNFCTFGMKNWKKYLKNNLDILEGKNVTQQSFEKYESTHAVYVVGDEEYNLDKEVSWKNLFCENKFEVSGRIIGGCLDCLDNILGTPYDGGKEFIEKYKDDGIIWYFDNCELTCEQVVRAMNKFKIMGYFEFTKAIIFGRPMTDTSSYGIDFKDALITSLKELNIPLIYDVDIGHVGPQMCIINGAIANIVSDRGKGKISFDLK